MSKFIDKIRSRYELITKIFLLLVSIAVLVMVFPKERKFKYEFQKGKPWLHTDLIAPFDFAINKPKDEVEQERKQILEDISPYFTYNNKITEERKRELQQAFQSAWDNKYGEDDMFLAQKMASRKAMVNLFDTIFETGIIRIDPIIEGKPSTYNIVLVRNNVATETQLEKLFTLQEASEVIEGALEDVESLDGRLISDLLRNSLVHNVFYDEKKTEAEKSSRLDAFSLTKGMVQQGELIISKGELITASKFQVLESLRISYENQKANEFTYYSILAGQVIIISVAMIILFVILWFYWKDIASSNKKLVLILSVSIITIIGTDLAVTYQVDYLYLIPFCLVPVIIRAFFSTRLAIYVHLITIIIAGFLVPDSFQFVFMQLIAGFAGIFSLYNFERRGQIFIASIWIFLSYSLIYTGKALIEEGDIMSIEPVNYAIFAGSSFLILFAYPLIYILEKIFGMITDITLIEMSNTNNKLLRDLAQKAPGTFQHSIQVANLAEEAIYEIGGKALLVRVGALYHDIGKMNNALYFVENQSSGVNPHDELTYEESANIIISHVLDGIEMAKKNNLPEEIIDFIRTHHGTRKVEYFYIKQKKDFPDEEVDEKTFSYHGPIPFSRETAVLMMADSVEAASRSLKRPDEEAINNLVEGIITRQVETDQFINSDITLRDITTIKKILKKKMKNIYHVRIAYPEE
jgi:cyclic-di-AMP phosphodiesterase PgpH